MRVRIANGKRLWLKHLTQTSLDAYFIKKHPFRRLYSEWQEIFDSAGWNASAAGTFNGTAAAVTPAGLPRDHNEQIDFRKYRGIKPTESLSSSKTLFFRAVPSKASFGLSPPDRFRQPDAFPLGVRRNQAGRYTALQRPVRNRFFPETPRIAVFFTKPEKNIRGSASFLKSRFFQEQKKEPQKGSFSKLTVFSQAGKKAAVPAAS